MGKKIKIILCLAIFLSGFLVWGNVEAATYYIDYETGDDARTAVQAQSQSTPWKTAPGMVGNWYQISGGWTEISTNIWQATASQNYSYKLRLGTSTSLVPWVNYSYWKGQWTTGVDYSRNSVVVAPDGKLYYCLSDHTSGTFATDQATYWTEQTRGGYSWGDNGGGSYDASKIRLYSIGNPDIVIGAVYAAQGAYYTRNGYAHAAGDVFIFKGGVTWPSEVLPLTIGYSGTTGNPDIYMGGQQLGTPWGDDFPVFDGGCSDTCASGDIEGITSSGKGYLTIDGLKITRTGFDKTSIFFSYPSAGELTVKNCELTVGQTGIGMNASGEVQYEKLYVYNNSFADETNGIFLINGYNSSTHANTFNDVQIYNNIFQGLTGSYDSGDYHPDGIQITGYYEWAFTNLKIYNNQFRGTWVNVSTSSIFLQEVNGAEIYNNLFAPESNVDTEGLFSPGCIMLGDTMSELPNDNIKIYGNTFSSDANYASYYGLSKGIFAMNNQGTVEIKNNIFSRLSNAIMPTREINLNSYGYIFLKYDGGEVTPVYVGAGYWRLGAIATALKTAIDTTFSITTTVEWDESSDWKFTITAPAGHTFEYDSTKNQEKMQLDVAPGGAGWSVGDTITGESSGATSIITKIISTTAYIVKDRIGVYTKGEILTNGTITADQGTSYPDVRGVSLMRYIGFDESASAAQTLTANYGIEETNFDIDYNIFYPRSGGHVITAADNYDTVGSTSAGCTDNGWNCNSKLINSAETNPKLFTTLPIGTLNSGDFSLQSDSPAIDVGGNLGASYSTDILGNTRTGTWDIGAYEYIGAADVIAPASPTGLSVS